VQNEAEALRNITSDGIATKLIAIGIGGAVSETELQAIASDPDSENVIKVDDFAQLSTIKDQLKDAICGGQCLIGGLT